MIIGNLVCDSCTNKWLCYKGPSTYHLFLLLQIDDFLTEEECDDLIHEASNKAMSQSPVAYAGWTEDLKLFVRAVPALVLPLVYKLVSIGLPRLEVAVVGIATWTVLVYVISTAGASWANKREEALQALRTSTSTVLTGESLGDRALVSLIKKSNKRAVLLPISY